MIHFDKKAGKVKYYELQIKYIRGLIRYISILTSIQDYNIKKTPPNFRQLFMYLALRECNYNDCKILKIIRVTDFCPLKPAIARFSIAFRLNFVIVHHSFVDINNLTSEILIK